MRVFLVLLFVAGGLICLLGLADASYEARLIKGIHAEVSGGSVALAGLVATAGLLLMAVSGFGVSALNKLSDMRDVLVRAQAANPGPNPYAGLPTYYDPGAKRG